VKNDRAGGDKNTGQVQKSPHLAPQKDPKGEKVRTDKKKKRLLINTVPRNTKIGSQKENLGGKSGHAKTNNVVSKSRKLANTNRLKKKGSQNSCILEKGSEKEIEGGGESLEL